MRVLSMALLVAPAAFAGSCESLASLSIPDVAVTSAAPMVAGPLSLDGPEEAPAASLALPAFCRVMAVARPTSDSEIHFEVWMPPADVWNGKFEGTGNGGFSGALGYVSMANALKKGYATAGSDTGHAGGDMKFAVGHPEKINDWAYRSVHVMTEISKLIIRDYYGRFPEYSYFFGCSTGGHEALTEAQRFPADYDGIVAGDPANNRVHLIAGFLWSWMAIYRDPVDPLPPEKLPVLYKAVMQACDAIDGLKDGVIDDPRRCKFDPGELLCKGSGDGACLTAPQVAAVRKIYEGAKNPRTGEAIFTGWPRGSEFTSSRPIDGWSGYIVGQKEPARADFWRYWVFHDPNFDLRSFDFNRDLAFADSAMAVVNSNETNLSAFQARKGRLLMYHGWADPVVPPQDGVRYYEAVQRAMGGPEKTKEFFRLFMAPGMAHCAGGPGPNTFDAVNALDQWVTKGVAPEKVVATHSTDGKIDRSRPLCPYPQVAKWTGTGSIDEAQNFVCSSPGADRRPLRASK